jgi:hypothetical protein
MLADKHDLITQIETRTSTAIQPSASLEPLLARFAAQVTKLSGRINPTAVEQILNNAAKAIADQEKRNGA